MKKRNILFGYQYQDGMITTHPQEVAVIKRIFSEYQNGMSLLDIANRLNAEEVEYQPGVIGWNKSRIMRLIEDERYTGKDSFPAVIDEKTHQAVSFHVTCKTQDGPTFRYARIRENPGTRLNTRFFRGKPFAYWWKFCNLAK